MRTVLAIIGCLLILVGLGIFAYAEMDYNNRMERILDMRNELSDGMAWAEQKYIETGELEYLQLYQEGLDLYLESFNVERINEDARSQGMYVGGLLIFAGIAGIVGGLLAKNQNQSDLCEDEQNESGYFRKKNG